MHTLVEVPVGGSNGGTHVPAFLAKLWKIVDDPSTNDLICWSEMGNSFIIKNQAKFARDLLPLYYKHNNMASFVRQLNMYGFHKVVSVEQGGLRVDKDEMEFAHPFFLKGQEASLELIKRKIPASKHEESRVRPDSLNKVLLDVRQMKGRQETMDNKLVTMKRENEALWRELASLRQKHAKQTQIVSKLLQFLVGMMSQQTPRLAFKRRMPLMLNDKDGFKQKLSRTDANEPTGPVIHDVTELLESDEAEDLVDQDQECLISNVGVPEKFSVQSPLSVPSKSPYSIGGHSPESPEILFSVDPAAVNPTVSVPVTSLNQLQQSAQVTDAKAVKPKAKQAVRKATPSATVTSVKTEVNAPFNNVQSTIPTTTQTQIQPQLLQVPGITALGTQAQSGVNVPTTLYFSAPGMTEPVQVVLSIPDQSTTTTVPTPSGLQTISTPIILPTTSANVANKAMNIQPQQQQQQQQQQAQPQIINAGSPMKSPSPLNQQHSPANLQQQHSPLIGRNQTVNPKIFLKSNGSIASQDLDGHLDEVEVGLSNLKDLFRGEDYHMDNDTLIGVSTSHKPYFNLAAIDPETYTQLFGGSPDNVENHVEHVNSQHEMTGTGADAGTHRQEVVAYNPSLFELAEEDTTFFDESSNMFLDDELESMLTTDRDTLKRPDGQTRNVGHLSFSGVNLNSPLDASLNTPISDQISSPLGTPAPVTGAGKRKRK